MSENQQPPLDDETREIHAIILGFSDQFFAGADNVVKLIELVNICNRQISDLIKACNERGAFTGEEGAAYSLTSCAARAILEVIADVCTTAQPEQLEKLLHAKIRERLKSAPVRLLTPPN